MSANHRKTGCTDAALYGAASFHSEPEQSSSIAADNPGASNMNNFQVNQIVKGAVAGHFVILAFRNIGGEQMAQVKPYNPETGKTGRGEMALPLDCIKAAQ